MASGNSSIRKKYVNGSLIDYEMLLQFLPKPLTLVVQVNNL